MQVKVRFAPSPTGNPHVGNMRTALFTFLFARKTGGKFILRIEDTDKKREVPESNQAILESLSWLGFKVDEGPILQSERILLYQEHAQKLLNQGLAYQSNGAVYFKTQKEGKTGWTDIIGRKKIEFENKLEDDFVLIKSDGWPTYHLASVVDDYLMGITHVTRGEDWISSTPKHIMLYRSFGWPLPQFTHFPNILASDRSKLSKRHGAIGILDFKKEGYLPQALVNFLVLLGWTPASGREILSLGEMIAEFDLKDINPAPAIFDIQKLEWMNGEYIRMMLDEELTGSLQEFLVDHPKKDQIAPVVPLIKERIKKLSDFIPLTDFLWEKPEYDKSQFQKLTEGHPERSEGSNLEKILGEILDRMEKLERPWQADTFEQTFRKLADEFRLPAGQIFQLIRVAISGQTITPPLFESIKILGEDETVIRIKEAFKFLS